MQKEKKTTHESNDDTATQFLSLFGLEVQSTSEQSTSSQSTEQVSASDQFDQYMARLQQINRNREEMRKQRESLVSLMGNWTNF